MKMQGKYFFVIGILLATSTTLIAQTLTSIVPNSAQQGESLSVTITGQNTHFAQGSPTINSVWFSQGSSTINASSSWPYSNTSLSASFNIPIDAALGSWNVNVQNYIDDTLTLSDGFTITYAPSPVLTSIVPDSAQQGQSLSVTITGQDTHFQQGSGTTGVWFSQGSPTVNIFASSYSTSSDTSVNADFEIPIDATLGLWDVHVSDDIDGTLTLSNGFTITPQTVTVIVHGYQPPPGTVPGWTYDMRQAILSRVAETYPGMVVIVFDWAEASNDNMDPLNSLMGHNAAVTLKLEARRLADQLINTHVVTADPSCHVHLIGHSRGGSLVSYAASLLNSHFGRRVVNHMTILDGIDEKSQIVGWYLQDPAICGNNANWTDNYYQTSGFFQGQSRPDADLNEEWLAEHGGFAEAYTDTIVHVLEWMGYWWSLGGGGWADPAKPHGRAFCSQSGTETVINGDYETQDLLSWFTLLGAPSVVQHGADNYVCQMEEQSSVAIAQTIMLPAHTRFLLFDFAFTDQGDGDSLTVTLGGTTIFTFVGTNFESSDLVSSGLIGISAFAGQISSELVFMLNSVGEPGATVLLDNIKVITAGDPDADGDVDMSDFSIFAAHWLHDSCNAPDWCDGTDIAPEIPDGLVDVLDLAKLAEHWLEGTDE